MNQPSVYILGAGMSVDAGIPAMNGLTNLILSDKYMLGPANIIGNFCAFAFPGLHIDMDMDGSVLAQADFVLDIEQFMSSLDAFRAYSDVTGTWKGLLISPERIMPLFLHLVGRVVADLTPASPPKYYVNFASTLRPGDTVVTLNWDCLLERACDVAQIRWSYPRLEVERSEKRGVIDPNAVTVVKLHGSVDWRTARAGLRFDEVLHSVDGQPAVVRTSEPLREEQQEFVRAGGHGELLLEGAPFGAGPLAVDLAETPFIIPPSHFKSFPLEGLPGLLWSCAWRSLKDASRVTVIGYSLPLTDYIPRWLLRIGLLFNHVTGLQLVREYLGYSRDTPLDSFEAAPENVNELRFQAMLAGVQDIMRCWDRACIPIEIVNPDPTMEQHFRRMVGLNVHYRKATAGEYFGSIDGTSA